MSRFQQERVLLIGDRDRQMQGALSQAMPGAQVTPVASAFDAIAELASPVDGTERGIDRYTAVMAAVEPIERRPETAVQTLRQLAGNARLLLFGHPTLEPLSRKMLSFGCDDYVVTPATPAELQQLFGAVPLRLTTDVKPDATSGAAAEPLAASHPTKLSLLRGVPLAEIVLDAMLQHPQAGPSAAARMINDQIGPTMRLAYLPAGKTPTPAPEGSIAITHAVRVLSEDVAILHLTLPRDEEESGARHFLAQLAHLIGKLATLEDRHTRLQKLAITDDLTGIYNGRYFRHFLTRIIEKARVMRFPVTLLLFDIDNFKKYNDLYGHGMGDEILREAAGLMKRCCREHDLVARISGDEFAVVFWEKEGPRQPRDAKPQAANAPAPASRLPQEPKQILERFQRMLSLPDFSNLGATGKGSLTISGGLAVYPYDAQDVQALIDAADQALVFGAKQGGKNRIHIVGQNEMNSQVT